MSKKTVSYLKLLFAVSAWGGSFIATKLALAEVSPFTIIWTRFAMGLVILGTAVFLRKEFFVPSLKDLGYFIFLGLLGVTWHQWLQATGLETSKASTTAWIVATTPIFIALLGWLVLKEKLGWQGVGGIIVAAFGVLLVVSEGDLGAVFQGSFGAPGDILILISSPNWAIFSVYSRRGLKEHPAAAMLLYVMLAGWLAVTILLFQGPGLSEFSQLTSSGWNGILFLGIAATGLAYIFWFDGLKDIPASQAGVFLYLEPLVTVIAAAFMLSEPILLPSILGGLIIFGGVWLVGRAKVTGVRLPPQQGQV